MKITLLVTLLTLAAALTLGCSDDTATPDVDAQIGAEAGAEAGVDAQTSDTAPIADKSTAAGTATDLKLGLHDNSVKVVLATMKVVGKDATVWDLYMAHTDPVDKLPHVTLGSGVTAQNLGNSTTFHAVDTAPTSGYTADDPTAKTYVIGSSWRNGGAGTTGFIMTKNIYALTLADGTYAKIEVLSAKSGEIHILAYQQSTPSDTNLKTAP
jgi:hypothetical protein